MLFKIIWYLIEADLSEANFNTVNNFKMLYNNFIMFSKLYFALIAYHF